MLAHAISSSLTVGATMLALALAVVVALVRRPRPAPAELYVPELEDVPTEAARAA